MVRYNHHMLYLYRYTFFAILLATFFLSSCAGFEPTLMPVAASPTPILQITPYWTPTSSPTSPSPAPSPSPTVTPLPSPTPITHTIQEGDMLGSIAFQYGLSVEDLLVANPDVDPAFLRIGSTLVVPLDESELRIEATPAPLPLHIGGPACYPTNDGGTFCFMLATNQGEMDLENISAKIDFISKDGESLAEEIAIPPLNVLPPGESLPVLAFFPTPLEPELEVQAEVLSALPLLDSGSRYVNVEVDLEEIIVDPEGMQATVIGQVALQAGGELADYLWLAAVAYAEGGDVIGVRKWEAPQDGKCLSQEMQNRALSGEQAVGCLSFDITVFSLGPEIERVEVYAEAGYLAETEPPTD
jgi:LysM repeat protein